MQPLLPRASLVFGLLRKETLSLEFFFHLRTEKRLELARRTGGEAFVAGDPAALQAVFEKIDAMQPAKFKPETPIPADNFRPFALAGLSMLALQLLSLFGIRFTPW